MKILIDENLPKRLKIHLSNYSVFTVRDMGWQSKSNGNLIRAMIESDFNVLITFDQNLQFQQNLKKYPVNIIVLKAKNNQFETLKPLLPKIENTLNGNLSNDIYILDATT